MWIYVNVLGAPDTVQCHVRKASLPNYLILNKIGIKSIGSGVRIFMFRF